MSRQRRRLVERSDNMVILWRQEHSDQGTFGTLYVEGKKFCKTGELPDRQNKPNISCIPRGTYQVVPYVSNRFGSCYLVQGVEGRAWILLHTGNYSGDEAKGYRTDVQGCILLGTRLGYLNDQRAVLASRTAFRRFKERMGKKEFTLWIV